MNNEIVYQIALATLIVSFLAVRMYYHRKAGTLGESISEDANKAIPFLRRVLGVPWVIGMFLYVFAPTWMAWAALPLPDEIRWLGIALSAVTILLLLWIHRALDRNFSTVARLHDHQTLITAGPYRWIRHPMYPTLWLFSLAAFLISANWFIGLPPLGIVTFIMLTRPPKEEEQLIEKFGDAYREYMKRTGRFLPKLSR